MTQPRDRTVDFDVIRGAAERFREVGLESDEKSFVDLKTQFFETASHDAMHDFKYFVSPAESVMKMSGSLVEFPDRLKEKLEAAKAAAGPRGPIVLQGTPIPIPTPAHQLTIHRY